MDKFLKPTFNKIVKADAPENVSTFTLEKLERGFANTIGNSMRRAILSSVPGLSAFAISIKGVSHEFQAVKNTEQDVVEIVLNLKGLVLKADSAIEDKEQLFELKLVSKNGKVTAKDIETRAGISIVNKNLFIAETSKDKALDMTIYVAFSKGYKTFEETRALASELIGEVNGIIPMDANFSPIEKVNVRTAEVNPGEEVVYERLIIEVQTKGNTDAAAAVAYAASVLENYYKAFATLNEANADEDFMDEIIETEEETHLSISIDSLNLSTRSENALLAAKIETVESLVELTVSQLKAVDNLGEKSVLEIIETIKELGLSFKSE